MEALYFAKKVLCLALSMPLTGLAVQTFYTAKNGLLTDPCRNSVGSRHREGSIFYESPLYSSVPNARKRRLATF